MTRRCAFSNIPSIAWSWGCRPEIIQARIAEVYERIGNMYAKDRQFDQAVSAYKKAQENAPDRRRKNQLQPRPGLHGTRENPPRPWPPWKLTCAAQPQGMEAYQMKIKLLERLGRAEQILPWLEQACRTDAFNNPLRLLLAGRFVQARQLDRAEKVYLDMHAKAPDVEVYRGLFRIYRQQGRHGMEKLLQMLNKTFRAGQPTRRPKAPNAGQMQGRAMLAALREDAELGKELTRQGLSESTHARTSNGRPSISWPCSPSAIGNSTMPSAFPQLPAEHGPRFRQHIRGLSTG